MSNQAANSNGSGLWTPQTAAKAHLIDGPGGLAAEVKDVRLDLAKTFGPEIGLTIDEWDGPPTGSTLVLTMIPKQRMGVTLIRREVMDGSPISPPTGTITQPGGPGTPWEYTPATAPNGDAVAVVTGTHSTTAATAATVTGSANATSSSLYGHSGSGLDGETVILTVNGVGPTTLTLSYLTNAASDTAFLAALNTAFPGLTATINGSNFLVLTDNETGTNATITVGSGTANTNLGLTPASTSGTGLYGAFGSLSTETLILTVNGVGPTTLTFSGTGNAANQSALITAVESTFAGITASVNGSGYLVLTDQLAGAADSITVGSGTSNTIFGFTPGTTSGTNPGAVVTGSTDMTNSALYGASSTLNGLTLILTVNGEYNVLTFNQPVNPVNPPYLSPTVLNPPLTILQQIMLYFPQLTASLSSQSSPGYLVLTDNVPGSTQSIVVGSGTANTLLGLTPGTTYGTGHSYSIDYEYDGTQVADGTSLIPGGAPYVNNVQEP